jgi:hypothetical protein
MIVSKKFIFISLLLLIITFSIFLPLKEIDAFGELAIAYNVYNFLFSLASDEGGGEQGWIMNGIINALCSIVTAIGGAIIGLGQFMLNYVLSPEFIDATGTNNPVVQEGWKMIRSLANAALIIGLVIIA